MWVDQLNEISDFFRNYLPYYLVILLPVFIILSPVDAAHEFPVYRLQHFDLQGIKYGSRSAVLNFEARSAEAKFSARKCVVARIDELTSGQFRELVAEGVGAVLLILPADLDGLSSDIKEHILDFEQFLINQEIPIPVYFTFETTEINEILYNVKRSTSGDSASSAAQALLGAVFANGYQLAVYGNQAKPVTDFQISTVHGKLPGFGMEEQLPTVAIVTHYDSFGAAPDLSFGGDSNASGVAALLELARLFSRLASQPGQNGLARFNLVFVITGGGKFNFLGSKKFLEDQLDSADGGLLQETVFALCLDSLGKGDELNVHVSKPPRDGSNSGNFFKNLQDMASHLYTDLKVNMVHKKINLADDLLAWEHERYSIRRLSAMTITHLKAAKVAQHRGTILDTKSSVDLQALTRNVQVIAETLATFLYNASGPFFEGDMGVSETMLGIWINHLTSQSRCAPSLGTKNTNTVIAMLEQAMHRYLKDVKITNTIPDKRDPEFVFYDQTKAVMTAYSVKPAVFDLFLTLVIVAYLGVVYFGVQKFHLLYSIMVRSPKSKIS